MKEDKDDIQEDLEWESRTLCSDESCIGVIGPDGRCKECGKSFEDRPPDEGRKAGLDAESADEYESDTEAADEEEDAETVTDIDWERRTLCSDESCIGIIGPNGRCKECGKLFENGR